MGHAFRKNKDYLILMADMIGSRDRDQGIAMDYFKSIVGFANKKCAESILSPLTITLGDEFQGVIKDTKGAIDILFELEENIIHAEADFKLRYILVEEQIDTPINPEIAYGMMGDGLTIAREGLGELKSSKSRFKFLLRDKEKSDILNKALFVYQSIIDNWSIEKDYKIVSEFLLVRDYKLVAQELDKTRSQMWKREKHLQIEQYFDMKNIIFHLALRNNES